MRTVNTAVLYQSLRGGTERAAHAIGAGFARHGDAGVYRVDRINAQFVLNSDLLVIGTWTDGLFGIAAKPAQLAKLEALPAFDHRDVALFVTYEISPDKSLAQLGDWAVERGRQRGRDRWVQGTRVPPARLGQRSGRVRQHLHIGSRLVPPNPLVR